MKQSDWSQCYINNIPDEKDRVFSRSRRVFMRDQFPAVATPFLVIDRDKKTTFRREDW